VDNTVSFSIDPQSLHHPASDEEVVAMADDVLHQQVLSKTLCKCPNLENPLEDCQALPEFTYFGSMCEPKLRLHHSPTPTPICFYLPEEPKVVPVVRLLKFADVLVDPSSGVILDRNKNSLFDNFMMKSLWSNIQYDIDGVIHIDKAASFVQVLKGINVNC
jgi:hypothetical protein